MTPEEVAIAERLRISLIHNITLFVPVSLAYGIFLYLFFHSTSIFMRRGLSSLQTKTMFLTSLTTVLLAGIQWATFLATFIITTRETFPKDLSRFGDASRFAAVDAQIFPLHVVLNLVDQLAIYISDGIVVWRAWVLFSDEMWMMAVPVALLIASIATGLAYISLMTSIATFAAVGMRKPVPAMKLVTANMALSLATNVAATLLVAYKLWSHRRKVGVKNLSALSAPQKILVLLIESGVIYCGVQLARLILYCSPGPVLTARYFVSEVAVDLATIATNIYPTVVIMFVNKQRTIVECFGFESSLGGKKHSTDDVECRAATPGHLSFAIPASQGTTHSGTLLGAKRSDVSSSIKEGTSGNSIEKRYLVDQNDSISERHTKTSPF